MKRFLLFAYQEVARFLHFKCTTQSMGEYSARLDLLRRRAESRMGMADSFSETFASILRMQNASLSRADISLVVGTV